MAYRSGNGIPALSIKQPFAEQILLGLKRIEYRSVATNRRGRVYIYASRSWHQDPQEWLKIDKAPAQLPLGRVVGSIEIIDCVWSDDSGCYHWHLSSPRRMPARRPENHPQPVWFYPFNHDSAGIPDEVPMEQGWLPFNPPAGG